MLKSRRAKANVVPGGRLPRDTGQNKLPHGASVHLALSDLIGSRIVSGEYPPGSILPNEEKWASDFKVSRSAVRESVKMLMAKNLLTSRPRIGSRVEPRENWNLLDHDVLGWYTAGPDRGKILRGLQQFRHIIEPEAAALAAVHRTAEQMDAISLACHQMATATNLSERSVADVRFHLEILKASANELLLPLGVLIDSALKNLFVLITVEAGSLRYAQDLHNRIERAIARQKPEAARLAVRRLLENSDAMVAKWEGKPR